MTVTNPAGVAIESYTYDAQGRLTKATDALGQATNTEYDSSNRPIRNNDRKGQATSIAYTQRGQVASITTSGGKAVSYPYDATCLYAGAAAGCNRWVMAATRAPKSRAVCKSPADISWAPASDGDCAIAPLKEPR